MKNYQMNWNHKANLYDLLCSYAIYRGLFPILCVECKIDTC